jgi:hypothetical protein
MREVTMPEDGRVQGMESGPSQACTEPHAAPERRRTCYGTRMRGGMMKRILRVRRHGREHRATRKQQRTQRDSMHVLHIGSTQVSPHN